jgi:hypothetical protein
MWKVKKIRREQHVDHCEETDVCMDEDCDMTCVDSSDDTIIRRGVEEWRKELQLLDLRKNNTTRLEIMAVRDEDYVDSMLHSLLFNSSVKCFTIRGNDTTEEQEPMTASEWSKIITGFNKDSRLCNRIEKLHIIIHSIPFEIIPTLVWQFRNLQVLKLEYATSFESRWTESHWQVVAAAIGSLSLLRKFHLRQVAYGNSSHSWSPNDTLVTSLVKSAPMLQDYFQAGLPRGARSNQNAPHLSVSSFVALLRCSCLKKLHLIDLCLQSSAMGPEEIVKALECSSIEKISLKGKDMDGLTVEMIVRGLLVSKSSMPSLRPIFFSRYASQSIS